MSPDIARGTLGDKVTLASETPVYPAPPLPSASMPHPQRGLPDLSHSPSIRG